ncbi:unnamed protein product, partial [Heterosigma akashiwo]
TAESDSKKKAKQEAAFLFIEEAYRVYEEENPGVVLDRAGLIRQEDYYATREKRLD